MRQFDVGIIIPSYIFDHVGDRFHIFTKCPVGRWRFQSRRGYCFSHSRKRFLQNRFSPCAQLRLVSKQEVINVALF